MLIQMLYEALVAMSANRMRSFLTMLGMMIGVASVVLMLAIGQTARDSVQKTIDSMGSHLFIILAGSANSGGIRSSLAVGKWLKVRPLMIAMCVRHDVWR